MKIALLCLIGLASSGCAMVTGPYVTNLLGNADGTVTVTKCNLKYQHLFIVDRMKIQDCRVERIPVTAPKE